MTFIIMKSGVSNEQSTNTSKYNDQSTEQSSHLPQIPHNDSEVNARAFPTLPRSSKAGRHLSREPVSINHSPAESIRMSRIRPGSSMEPNFERINPKVDPRTTDTVERLHGSHVSRGSSRSRNSRTSSSHHSVPVKKPLKTRLKDFLCIVVAFTFSNVGVCGLFVGYTIMGSFLFQAIEKDKNAFKKSFVDNQRNSTLEVLWEATETFNTLNFVAWNETVTEEMKRYQLFMVDSIGRGYTGNDDVESYDPWSFEGGFLYSLTVITTIGYGHISPKTVTGKVMTIFYTIFGMPVFLLYMANMGDILARTLKWTYSRLCVCRRPKPQPAVYEPSALWRSAAVMFAPISPEGFGALGLGEPRPDGEEAEQVSVDTQSWRSIESEPAKSDDISSVNIPLTVSLVILFALLYGGTELFQSFEDWDPLTSFYFCFVSLTTIGFGDIVPGSSMSSDDRINFIYCSLYLMFGLALLSMCFNLMQEEVVHKVSLFMRSISGVCTRGRDTET